MKKGLFLIAAIVLSVSLNAQTNEQKAVDELNIWSEDLSKALNFYTEIKSSKEDSPEICNKARDAYRLFQSAIQHCESAQEYFPDYSKDIKLFLVETYVAMSWFNLIDADCVKKVFTDEVFNTSVSKTFDLRPYETSIPLSDLKLTFYDQSEFNRIYSDQIYLGYLNCERQNNQNCRRTNALEYIRCLRTAYGEDFISDITSDSTKKYQFVRMNIIVKNSEEYLKDQELWESKTIMMELYAAWLVNKKKNDPDAGFSNSDIKRLEAADKILGEIKDDGTSATIDNMLVRLYNANMLMGEKRIANNYLTEAKLHDHSNVDELYDYIEKTKAWRDETSNTDDRSTAKDRIRKACNMIYEKINSYAASYDLEKLLAFYQYIDDSNGIATVQQKLEEVQEKEKKDERREKLRQNWGLCVGTAPGKLIWAARYNQVSVHADLLTAGFSHGIRYCSYDFYTDKSRFGANRSEDGEEGSSNTYSGWEGSWWINFNEISSNSFSVLSPYLEFRYGQYDFNSVITSVIDRETDTYAFIDQTIDPVGKRFDVTYGMKGTFWLMHRLYFQTVAGFGFGYRWLETGYDNKKYYLESVNFGKDRWPKVTMPLRLGIRVGICLF